jgi:hypothetical protein
MAACAALCADEKVVPSPTPTKLYLIEYCRSSPLANHVGSPAAKRREKLKILLIIIFIITACVKLGFTRNQLLKESSCD